MKPQVPVHLEPEYHPELIAVYSAFQGEIMNPVSVLHPCGAWDASPSRVFSEVTYVEKEDGCPGAMEMFRRHGLRAFKMDIQAYRPKDPHDLLILLNPAIPTEWASRHLAVGGYVLTNDWSGNASEMGRDPEHFSLAAVIDFVEKDRRKGDHRVVVSRNLDGYFEPVSNMEGLREHRQADYDFLKRVVPHSLRSCQERVEGSFEDQYRRFRKLQGLSEGLPARRDADRYVFVKKA